MRGALAFVLALAAWFTLPPAGTLGWTEHFFLDVPIRFESGFTVQRHFSVDSAGHFALLLLRGVTRSGVESINDFEHQGLVAAYRIASDGATVASGRYPPYDVMTRWKGYDYHSFGGFWAVPHRDYEFSFTFEEAAAAAAAAEGHLRVAYDPVHAPEAKSKALLANIFGIAALVYVALLAQSLWTTFRDRHANTSNQAMQRTAPRSDA
jgi:hypothetical protein